MKSTIRHVDDHGVRYDALMFACPGCANQIHMLAVNSDVKSPSWTWDGDLEQPTLSPSILTRYGISPVIHICHSYLVSGVFQYLSDCTHALANCNVPIPDLPSWVEKMT